MTGTTQLEYMPTSVQRRNLITVVIDGAVIGLMSAAASFASVFVIRLGASPLWVSLLWGGVFLAAAWAVFVRRDVLS